jgi:hypothetical protein
MDESILIVCLGLLGLQFCRPCKSCKSLEYPWQIEQNHALLQHKEHSQSYKRINDVTKGKRVCKIEGRYAYVIKAEK